MLSAYESSRRPAPGRRIDRGDAVLMPTSQRERRHVDPAPRLPALERRLDELHALGAFAERPLVRLVVDDVADEVLPLDLEAVVVELRVGDVLPLVEEVHRLLDVGVPDRPRRRDARLDAAVVQTGNRGAVGAVDVEGD